jgi:hypothetical protein
VASSVHLATKNKLPPLIFGLLVGFVAVEVCKAKLAVATEASALRAVTLLVITYLKKRMQLRTLINPHINEAVNREWSEMAQQHVHY